MPQTTRVIAACVAGAFLLSACNDAAPAGPDAGAPPVPVAAPLAETVADWAAYSGRFAAPQDVEVRARVGGYLDSVHFADGQQVQKGDLLFTIDPRPYEALAASARGDVARAEAQLSQARRELARLETLREARAASQEELESAESALEQAEAAHTAAQANMRSHTLDLEFTRITAPISGRVSDRRVDPGNLVGASDEVLTTVVASDPIHFEFEAPEADMLAWARAGRDLDDAPVHVRLQGDVAYGWNGTLNFADNALDSATGTLRLRAVIANPDGVLRPGMYGEAQMQGSDAYTAVLVPQTAVLADATRRLVYVVGEDNVVQARPVTLGAPSGEFRVVLDGLAANERIVVSGLLGIQPGMTVDPQMQTLARAPASGPGVAQGYGGGVTAAAALPVQ